MKLPKILTLLGALLGVSSSTLYATEWEFGMRVLNAAGTQCTSSHVYLYNYGNLSVPIRSVVTAAGAVSENFKCDINDYPYGTQEPNYDYASWRVIWPGHYALRVENEYCELTIPRWLNTDNPARDFTLEYRPGVGFSRWEGNRPGVGQTYSWTIVTNCQMSMDQKFSDGSTTVGDLFHVFPDGMDIWTAATAQTISIYSPSTQTFRADTLVYSGQKYHDWNGSSDVSNHHPFSVTGTSVNVVSYFLEHDNSITVTTDLLDVPGTTAGNIEFADPWFRDYQDASYNGRLRNQGTSPQFHQRQASFNPNESSSYAPYASYNGVFLNQGSSEEWIEPYYSVGALSPISFPNGSAVFAYWAGSSVQLQSATSARTGVIFTATGAQAKAWYKYHLGSTVSSPTSYNSQRKVAKRGSRYHMVYASGGRIWYATSTDNCATWSVEQQASHDFDIYLAMNPSLFVDNSNTMFLAYELVSGSSHLLDVRRKTLTGGWEDLARTVQFDGSLELKPVIEGAGSRYTAIVQTSGFDQNGSPGLYYLTNLDPNHPVIAKVPETSSSSISPTLTFSNLAYQDGNAIYLKHFTYGSSDITFATRQLVSSNYVNGRLVKDISNPSIDIRTPEEGSERRPVITWQATDQIFTSYRPIFVRHSIGGTDLSPTFQTDVFDWGTSNAKGRTPVATACYSGTYTNPDVAAVWQHDPSDPNGSYPYVVAVNKVSGSFGSQSTLSTSGRYCTSVQGDANQSNGGALAAWSSASGPVYGITANQGTNGTLSKSSPPRLGRGIDVDLVDLGIDGLSGIVSLYVEETGGVTLVPTTAFVSLPDDFLCLVIQAAQPATIAYRLSVLNLQLPASIEGKLGDMVIFSMENASTAGISFPLGNITLQDLLGIWAKRTRLDDNNESAATVGQLTGLAAGAAKIVPCGAPTASESHLQLYEFVLPSDSSPLQKDLVQAEPMLKLFELGPGYPNPFNPSTTLRFGLPTDAQVRLAVYDLLGREVARLADGFHQAGYHTVNWNAQNAASGLYFARLVVTSALGKVAFTKTNKLLLTR